MVLDFPAPPTVLTSLLQTLFWTLFPFCILQWYIQCRGFYQNLLDNIYMLLYYLVLNSVPWQRHRRLKKREGRNFSSHRRKGFFNPGSGHTVANHDESQMLKEPHPADGCTTCPGLPQHLCYANSGSQTCLTGSQTLPGFQTSSELGYVHHIHFVREVRAEEQKN